MKIIDVEEEEMRMDDTELIPLKSKIELKLLAKVSICG